VHLVEFLEARAQFVDVGNRGVYARHLAPQKNTPGPFSTPGKGPPARSATAV
jgi:hypothetical protein